MKIKINFGISKLVLLAVVGVLALGAVIVNLLFLIGVGNMVTNVPIAAGISMGFSVLIIAFDLTIFLNSYYKFSETELISNVSFFQDKITYEDITGIKENSQNNALYIIFKFSNKKVADGTSSLRLLVKKEDNQKIVEFLNSKNSSILYETFTSEK